ncbi:MAG TPA: hypothetical protein VFB78_09110, partial [Acidimicrobiales bacterium]|nr:hypothetical protein [Acidimicrobiales bacterium]
QPIELGTDSLQRCQQRNLQDSEAAVRRGKWSPELQRCNYTAQVFGVKQQEPTPHTTKPDDYMRRFVLLFVGALLLAAPPVPAKAASQRPALAPPDRVSVATTGRAVEVHWSSPRFPRGATQRRVALLRDGKTVATSTGGPLRDAAVGLGQRLTYTVVAQATVRRKQVQSAPSTAETIQLPAYFVGGGTADITPAGLVNLGGFGLGDGRLLPDAAVGRGGQGKPEGEHIRARAMVIDDGHGAIAVADIETQGMFAAYQHGAWGLLDMATRVAKDIPGLPADHIIIAADHTHSGPDTIGAWGGVSDEYMSFIADRTVAAIERAYRDREFASLRVGTSDASDIIYNQSCTEALNQDATPAYTGPDVCATPGKDGMVRVLQARSPAGKTVLTMMAFAAHSTSGGGRGIHGDWPQFVSEAMSAKYGGTGLAMEGANGGTQPCRPTCSFSKADNPGRKIRDRKPAIVANYMRHVDLALGHTRPVTGPVAGAQQFIREPIVGPAVLALFAAGKYAGADLMRSRRGPWQIGTTVGTVVSAVRVGNVVLAGTPGEGFPAIGNGLRDAAGSGIEVMQLGLANDQLGYLIAPATYVPIIAAEVAVNDNIIFNVSPTIGDHVMCTGISLLSRLQLNAPLPPACAPYAALDATGV